MAAGNWVDWNTGDLVTAASFQDIQDSILFIYADDSAANTALTNKVEGTAYYNTTDNVLKIWDGAAWTEVGGAGGLSEADTWWMTANLTSSADPISANLSRANGTLQALKGTGMTESSGLWTFPSTGYYYVAFNANKMQHQQNSNVIDIYIISTDDNFSTEDTIANSQHRGNNGTWGTPSITTIVKITDTSNDKIKFKYNSTGAATLYGGTNGETQFMFMKLGDI